MLKRQWVILAAAALILTSFVQADVVRMKDGREFIGKILEEKSRSVVIDTKISNIRSTVTLQRREIASIEKAPLPDGFFEGKSEEAETPKPRETTRPAPRESRPVTPAAPSRPEDVRYLEVPLEGGFGTEIFPIGVSEALNQAKRRGVQHIVFRINSDGGYIWAAEDIARIMEENEDAFTYHALIEKAISASIWVALSCDTMHMTPGATIGAAVVYTRDSTSGNTEVDAKFNSAMAAKVAARAEKHGHNIALVRAMMIGESEAYAWKDESGEWCVGAERPKLAKVDSLRTLDDRDTVLTLTAQEADELGFAKLVQESELEAIRERLGIEQWRGSGRAGANEMEQARKKAQPIFDRFKMLRSEVSAGVERANAADPTNFGDYYVDYGGNLTDASRRDWQRRTDAAISEWNRVRALLIEFEKLEREREGLGMSRWIETVDIKSYFDQVTESVRRLQEDRDRR